MRNRNGSLLMKRLLLSLACVAFLGLAGASAALATGFSRTAIDFGPVPWNQTRSQVVTFTMSASDVWRGFGIYPAQGDYSDPNFTEYNNCPFVGPMSSYYAAWDYEMPPGDASCQLTVVMRGTHNARGQTVSGGIGIANNDPNANTKSAWQVSLSGAVTDAAKPKCKKKKKHHGKGQGSPKPGGSNGQVGHGATVAKANCKKKGG